MTINLPVQSPPVHRADGILKVPLRISKATRRTIAGPAFRPRRRPATAGEYRAGLSERAYAVLYSCPAKGVVIHESRE